MENKIHLYAKIDGAVKDRAALYVTNCKLMKNKTDTLGRLIEESLEEYMITHPL